MGAINQIVYLRLDKVYDLFQIFFDVDVYLEPLNGRIENDKDIVLRIGYDDMKSLIEEIEAIIKNIAEQMVEISQ